MLLAALLMVALPFLFRPKSATLRWSEGDPVLVVISPHNEAIRQEFGTAFSAWHLARYGVPRCVDWPLSVAPRTCATCSPSTSLDAPPVGAERPATGRCGGPGSRRSLRPSDFRPTRLCRPCRLEAQRRLWLAFRTTTLPAVPQHTSISSSRWRLRHERANVRGLDCATLADTNAIPAGLFSERWRH